MLRAAYGVEEEIPASGDHERLYRAELGVSAQMARQISEHKLALAIVEGNHAMNLKQILPQAHVEITPTAKSSSADWFGPIAREELLAKARAAVAKTSST